MVIRRKATGDGTGLKLWGMGEWFIEKAWYPGRRINFRARLKIGDRSTPVCDLPPRVDVSAEVPAARAEIAMVVQKHDQAGRGECPAKRSRPC